MAFDMGFTRKSHKTGQTYVFHPYGDQTIISIQDTQKSIVVDHHVGRLNISYYNWREGGLLIQEAFPYLTNDEREFLMTGIVQQEWDEIFPDDD